MAILEYIYVDARRLNAYVDQIGPPVTYDKVPVWSTELGLTGPKASAAQERHGRLLTQHEKVETLLKHLTVSKLLQHGRPAVSWRRDEPTEQFVLESCRAARVEIPRKVRGGDAAKELSLWISVPEPSGAPPAETEGDSPGLLCLLEDFKYADGEPFNGYSLSAFSVLWSITWSLREEMRSLVIGDEFESVEIDDSWGNRTDAWHKSRHHMDGFIQDPIGSLQSWGCTPGPVRRVRVLYRIREYGPECGEHRRPRESVSIFGYPIVIWDANDVA